jgi:hypothetical protein
MALFVSTALPDRRVSVGTNAHTAIQDGTVLAASLVRTVRLGKAALLHRLHHPIARNVRQGSRAVLETSAKIALLVKGAAMDNPAVNVLRGSTTTGA